MAAATPTAWRADHAAGLGSAATADAIAARLGIEPPAMIPAGPASITARLDGEW